MWTHLKIYFGHMGPSSDIYDDSYRLLDFIIIFYGKKACRFRCLFLRIKLDSCCNYSKINFYIFLYIFSCCIIYCCCHSFVYVLFVPLVSYAVAASVCRQESNLV
jgi:hypothetical protein